MRNHYDQKPEVARDREGRRQFFFGPVSKAQAEHLVDYLLDDPGMREAIVELLTHRLAPGELEYRVQMMAEAREELESEERGCA